MADYVNRILIVDDNKSIHTDFKQILCPTTHRNPSLELLSHELFDNSLSAIDTKPISYKIDDAFSGEEAIELVKKSFHDAYPYSLIFMDIRMSPGIDGVQTIHKIWQHDPYIEIIICTSYSDYSWEEIISNFPSTDQLLIIRKPFNSIAVKLAALSLTKKWDLNRKNREYIGALREEVRKRTKDLNEKNEQLLLEIENHRIEELERRKLENELHQARKMDAIGQLAGGIAHDFNNMLGAITGYAEMIKDNIPIDNEKLNKYVDIIISTSRNSANLTSQLLTFARKGNIKIVPVDIHDITLEVLKILEHSIDKSIVIKKRLHAGHKVIMGDYSQLQNVFFNLALNARDAMPEGGELVFSTDNIELDHKNVNNTPFKVKPGSYILVSVSDTGIGINEETKARIFEPFFTTKENGKGTGLGLASVYGVVQSHKGLIEVQSQPGKGTVFNIYFPLIDSSKINLENISESTQKILL